ncbi:hypothetical protein [Gordonia sp. SND2]|uniref:hypothetical protein n=1 Tax=Gordonia sp. SND2 TaxID=3388659 RepID=UPI00398A9AE2
MLVTPDEFGPSGAALWRELHDEGEPAEMVVLVREACRIADRLDRLASAVRGDGLFDLVEKADGVFQVYVDNALSEARQQAAALQRILTDLAKRRETVGGGEEPDGLDGL